MSRWNISDVVFYSIHGQKRVLEFAPSQVSIITGASGTGKSYVIQAIDYCLGSSSLNLSNLIQNKLTHVAVKWVKGDTQVFVARRIPIKSAATGEMFMEIGSKIRIPDSGNDLKGKINETEARTLLADEFGITDFKNYETNTSSSLPNVSIRQLTPYLFLDKSVIDSNKIILYGLDDPKAARHIIPSIPYFLNAIDIDELLALNKLKGLKKGIDAEESKRENFEQHQSKLGSTALTLKNEAVRAGLLTNNIIANTNDEIIAALKNLTTSQIDEISFENDELLNELQKKSIDLHSERNAIRRKRAAALQHNETRNSFKGVSEAQLAKLDVDQVFRMEGGHCPICDNNLAHSSNTAKLIKRSFDDLKRERKVVHEYGPRLDNYISDLDEKLEHLANRISTNKKQLENLIKESEIAEKQTDLNNRKLRTLGRISYFLDNHEEIDKYDESTLNKYKRDYDEIIEKYGKDQREERIQEAERLISTLATNNIKTLPIGTEYEKDSINFISKQPTVTLTNPDSGAIERFPGIGSDENYLSIHLALLFAFHKFFEDQQKSKYQVFLYWIKLAAHITQGTLNKTSLMKTETL